jgi:hypothetical protein
MSALEWAGAVAVMLLALALWGVAYVKLRRRWPDVQPVRGVAQVPVVEDDTEYVVREPAIYQSDPTVQVNIRQPQPWELAK